jgi:hypothetical protein
VIGNQAADKMLAQWQTCCPSYNNKYKKKSNPARRMDGSPPQANLVEQKMNPHKGKNKRPAVLMFENQEDNDNSLKMDFFNYN